MSVLVLRFALRELRGGLSGFFVLIACIALGVAAIAGVNSVARGMTQSIQTEGRVILGGDLALSRVHTPLSQAERAFIQKEGELSEVASLRAMLRVTDQKRGSSAPAQTLVDLKAVDQAYPLYGAFTLVAEPPAAGSLASDAPGAGVLGPGGELQPKLARQKGYHGIILAQEIGAQLRVKQGDLVDLGRATFQVRGFTQSEPDRLATGIAIGPRVIISAAGLSATQLVQPGSLLTWHYRLKLDPSGGASDAALQRVITDIASNFPKAGWRVTSRSNAAPGLSENIERFAQFLTLVGLTVLVAGGVGVANSVAAFVDSKRTVIATFKCLGARGSFVFWVYLTQILLIAALGIALGLVMGAATPLVAAHFLGELFPVDAMRRIFPLQLSMAVLYGLLTALAFAIWPLGQSHDIQPTAVLRDKTTPGRGLPRPIYLVATGLVVLALGGFAIGFADDRWLASVFLAAVSGMLLLLRLVAAVIAAMAKSAPQTRRTELRLAIRNIYRPGALTPSIVLSLGLGLAVLVSLSLIDANIRNQLIGNLPDQAPSFFFVDVQKADVEAFRDLLKAEAPEAVLDEAPMLRGRIISLGGIKSEDLDQDNEEAWVLRGDRGITFRQTPPPNAQLVEGEWWPATTSEALVSMDQDVMAAFQLQLGDEVVVNVLGREVSARIANSRSVEWQSLAINFVMIFSPPTFAGAPYPSLMTLTYPQEAPTYTKAASEVPLTDRDRTAQELALLAKVSMAFPTITAVRVKDAINAVNNIVADLALAVRLAAAVTLVASVFVLAGALAAGQRRRVQDAILLKTLGATRWRVLATFLLEYAILGVSTAVFSLIAGGLAAYFIIDQIMQITFSFQPSIVAGTVVIALVLTLGFGMVGTWRILGQKPATILRNQ